jgi:hypothetical protein
MTSSFGSHLALAALLLAGCGSKRPQQASECGQAPSIHEFVPPVVSAATLSSVESILSEWPTTTVAGVSAEDQQRRATLEGQLLRVGRQSLQHALVWLLAGDSVGQASDRYSGPYEDMNLSPEPIRPMLMTANLNQKVRNGLYLLLMSPEDPLPTSVRGVRPNRQISAERRTYVCRAAERFLHGMETGQARQNAAHEAGVLIGMLRAESSYGPPEVSAFLQEPLIKEATTALVEGGYLSQE